MEELRTVMGSETEFGLIFQNNHEFRLKRERLLASLYDKLTPKYGPKTFAEMFKSEFFKAVNWWREDLGLNRNEDENPMDDAVRRMGLTGEYLGNGARLYIDGAHPEYSTPECLDPLELVAHELAGEATMYRTIQQATEETGESVLLLKRNWDYHQSSYACHENYLLSRKLFQRIVDQYDTYRTNYPLSPEQIIWVAHLVSRILYTGSGRLDISAGFPLGFSISQRSPFITHFGALDTTSHRAVINTRDRPYADPKLYARLHVICGDSNRADWSNILKYGVSRLVLLMLEDMAQERFFVENAQRYQFADSPEQVLQAINKNPDAVVRVSDGNVTAREIQLSLAETIQQWLDWKKASDDMEIPWAETIILPRWKFVLNAYNEDIHLLDDKIDHRIKWRLFESAVSRGRQSKQIQAIDYNYHVVGKGSLFQELIDRGDAKTIVSEEAVKNAMNTPPASRAALRTLLAQKLTRLFRCSISWHSIFVDEFRSSIRMPDPASPLHFATQNKNLEKQAADILEKGGGR